MDGPVKEIHVTPEAFHTRTMNLPSGHNYRIVMKPHVLPVIIVPGIMGTRLRTLDGQKVWDPDDSWFMAKTFIPANARKRQTKLLGPERTFNPDYVHVDEHDEDHADKNFPLFYEKGLAQGWTGVAWRAYGKVLRTLTETEWNGAVSYTFRLPIYASGYDWRDSNEKSGDKLAEKIDRLTSSGYGKVIILTHSMGGFVTRAACKVPGIEKKILGIVHTVQPVTGAAAAYWRMRAGIARGWSPLEKAGAYVLGPTGLAVQAVLGHLPGALQLLPSKDYTDNANSPRWLHVIRPDGVVDEWPQKNPYDELYLSNNQVHGMVTPAYLTGARTADDESIEDALDEFQSHIRGAEKFTEKLSGYQHPKTTSVYGTGHTTVDKIRLHVTNRPYNPWVMPPEKWLEDDGQFKKRLNDNQVLRMDAADGDGDATVPISSGSYLQKLGGINRDVPVTHADHESGLNDLESSVPTVQKVINKLCRNEFFRLIAACRGEAPPAEE